MQKMVAGFVLLFVSVFLLPCAGWAEKQTVLVVPGIIGSMSKDLFCNHKSRSAGLPEELVIDPIFGTYEELIQNLGKAGFRAIPVPYDWRKSIRDIANTAMRDAVSKWSKPGEPVDIVAHSMGGLVARYFIEFFGGENIRQVIFLGTPHRGSLATYGIWEGGKPVVADQYSSWVLIDNMKRACGCARKSDALFVRQGCANGNVSQLFSVKELIYQGSFLKRKKLGIMPREDYCESNELLSILNANADAMHLYGITYTVIAGTGTNTPLVFLLKGRHKKKNKKRCLRKKTWRDGKIKKKKTEYGDGDERVLYNESACPKAYIPAFKNISCIEMPNVTHGDLPSAASIKVIHQLLKDVRTTPSSTTITTTTTTSSTTATIPTTTTMSSTTTTTTLPPSGDYSISLKWPELIVNFSTMFASGHNFFTVEPVGDFAEPITVQFVEMYYDNEDLDGDEVPDGDGVPDGPPVPTETINSWGPPRVYLNGSTGDFISFYDPFEIAPSDFAEFEYTMFMVSTISANTRFLLYFETTANGVTKELIIPMRTLEPGSIGPI